MASDEQGLAAVAKSLISAARLESTLAFAASHWRIAAGPLIVVLVVDAGVVTAGPPPAASLALPPDTPHADASNPDAMIRPTFNVRRIPRGSARADGDCSPTLNVDHGPWALSGYGPQRIRLVLLADEADRLTGWWNGSAETPCSRVISTPPLTAVRPRSGTPNPAIPPGPPVKPTPTAGMYVRHPTWTSCSPCCQMRNLSRPRSRQREWSARSLCPVVEARGQCTECTTGSGPESAPGRSSSRTESPHP